MKIQLWISYFQTKKSIRYNKTISVITENTFSYELLSPRSLQKHHSLPHIVFKKLKILGRLVEAFSDFSNFWSFFGPNFGGLIFELQILGQPLGAKFLKNILIIKIYVFRLHFASWVHFRRFRVIWRHPWRVMKIICFLYENVWDFHNWKII